MPNMSAASPRYFFEKLLSNTPLCFPENSTSFPVNNMSFTYTYQKGCSAPTHFLVNTGFSKSLYKTIFFYHTIKVYIPTPRCLHQSIDGSWSLHTLLASLGLTKPSGCIIYNSNKSIKECSFDIHLPDFIKCGNC